MSRPGQMKMIPAQIAMIQFDAASTDSSLFSQIKIIWKSTFFVKRNFAYPDHEIIP